MITNNSSLIKSSRPVELEISDYMLTHSSIHIRNKPVRTYRNLNLADFQRDVASAPWSVCTVFVDPDDRYWSWMYTAISRKVVGKSVHATIPKGNMGYDKYTVPDFVAVEPTFVAFL